MNFTTFYSFSVGGQTFGFVTFQEGEDKKDGWVEFVA